MSNPTTQKIIKKYQDSLSFNFSHIEDTLKDLGIYTESIMDEYKSMLTMTSGAITQKWASKLKYLRTVFVVDAFGDDYPEEYLEVSIMTDAMINILDDLLDEAVDKKARTIYIIEILRVFSVLYSNEQKFSVWKKIGLYFDELITLAKHEQRTVEKVKATSDLDNIIDHSFELLVCRGMDIDVFIDFAIQDMDEVPEKEIKKMGRLFRGANIFKKDILDIEHDRSTEQESLATYMEANPEHSFSDYIKLLGERFVKESETILSIDVNSERGQKLMRNFRAMLETEVNQFDSSYKQVIE